MHIHLYAALNFIGILLIGLVLVRLVHRLDYLQTMIGLLIQEKGVKTRLADTIARGPHGT